MNRNFSKDDLKVANRYGKKCLISLIIREMPIKTTRRYLLRMVMIKETKGDKYWRGHEKRKPFHIVGRNIN
jgi:hypothetical protein